MKLLGNKRLLILMLGLILFIALMGLTFGNRGYQTWPERFVKDTVSWVQGMIYKPVGYIAGLFEDIREFRTVYEENKVLRQTVTKYARDATLLNALLEKNKDLEEALGFTERQKQMNKTNFRIAEVVDYKQAQKMVTINLGEKDGIRANMAVVSVTNGLVGRVVSTANFYSDVQLITGIDDKASVDADAGAGIYSKAIALTVKGKEEKSFGVLETVDADTGLLLMTKIEPGDDIQPGDTVITSGKGLVFPYGIEVGKVVEKRQGDFGITYVATIQPFASFTHLREVFVVDVPEAK
ncbi:MULTISPECIES: rod shape-determining protein MreC [Paenibacillus]|uniref:rod shape-determining protein MreC n=1 Tax=Paenibacillus TaxID=44249 RepID=UPI0022B8939B|nr:rod shape-determining protein MreC [Paenibacillus caseinilyticus]MCZ8519089.1 rod shape-determining protein MreC [Paenibacillus caseinilyticus]